jgi:preprotein translocase subunit SecD
MTPDIFERILIPFSKVLETQFMKKFYSIAIIFLGTFLLFSSAMAKPGVDHLHNVLIFQVGDTRLLFDSSVIQTVTATKGVEGKHYSLNITLVPSEAAEFAKLSQANIGKKASLILNKKIIGPSTIQTQLSASFEVPGFTKEEAENFVRYINSQKQK